MKINRNKVASWNLLNLYKIHESITVRMKNFFENFQLRKWNKLQGFLLYNWRLILVRFIICLTNNDFKCIKRYSNRRQNKWFNLKQIRNGQQQIFDFLQSIELYKRFILQDEKDRIRWMIKMISHLFYTMWIWCRNKCNR